MRLYNYLSEEDKMKRLTESFFKEFGNAYMSDDFIWRGHKDKIETHKTKKRRHNRKPRLLPKELHEYLDDISMELFGWNVRSQGIFCGDYGLSTEWGKPYIFVPIGNYRYIWTTEYYEIYNEYNDFNIGDDEEIKNNKKDELYRLYEENYKTNGLSKAVEQDAEYEAIFDCDHYLLINPSHWETMKEDLLK